LTFSNHGTQNFSTHRKKSYIESLSGTNASLAMILHYGPTAKDHFADRARGHVLVFSGHVMLEAALVAEFLIAKLAPYEADHVQRNVARVAFDAGELQPASATSMRVLVSFVALCDPGGGAFGGRPLPRGLPDLYGRVACENQVSQSPLCLSFLHSHHKCVKHSLTTILLFF
jgi:hypothetical protein